jgi:hypothetical protein
MNTTPVRDTVPNVTWSAAEPVTAVEPMDDDDDDRPPGEVLPSVGSVRQLEQQYNVEDKECLAFLES